MKKQLELPIYGHDYEFKLGDRVRHRHSGAQGEVVAQTYAVSYRDYDACPSKRVHLELKPAYMVAFGTGHVRDIDKVHKFEPEFEMLELVERCDLECPFSIGDHVVVTGTGCWDQDRNGVVVRAFRDHGGSQTNWTIHLDFNDQWGYSEKQIEPFKFPGVTQEEYDVASSAL